MYCSKCGAQIEPHSNFCPRCGEVLGENKSDNTIDNNYQSNQNTNFQPTQVNTEFQSAVDNQQLNQYATNLSQNEKKSNSFGVASLVLGIVSFLTSLVFLISLPTGIVGLIMGIKSKVKNAVTKAGIVFSSIGLALTAIFIALIIYIITILSGASNTNTYYGNGFDLKYDKNWSVATLSNGQEALRYRNDSAFLVPIGASALSDSTSDFNTSSGKEELYQSFYDYWNNSEETLDIFSGSDGFNYFTDEIYYATYNYGVSSTEIRGKYILLVSEENNAVLSFMTNSEENVEKNDQRALELLKNIEIYSQEDTTTQESTDDSDYEVIYDDELYSALDKMRNWNRYSDLRSGDLGKKKSINGGWRILSDSESYWEFKDGEFWWYESVDNLSDNYWYGETTVLTGKTGLATAGIDASKIDEIIERSSGDVTANDIYTVVCTPTKIISDGVDKSETNIPDGTTWNYVWIIVDHGSEGIEAQVLNLTNYEASYYVKIKD